MTDADKPAIDEAIRAAPSELAAMVAIQDAAIVSRTLVDKPAGTVTLFAFDAGQSLSEHTTPFDALVQVLEGRMQITISDEPADVAAGAAIVMPANAPHALKALEQTKMLLVMIRS